MQTTNVPSASRGPRTRTRVPVVRVAAATSRASTLLCLGDLPEDGRRGGRDLSKLDANVIRQARRGRFGERLAGRGGPHDPGAKMKRGA